MGRLFANRQQAAAAPAKTANRPRRAPPTPAQGRDLTRVPLSQTVRDEEEAAPAPVSRTDAGVKGGAGSPH